MVKDNAKAKVVKKTTVSTEKTKKKTSTTVKKVQREAEELKKQQQILPDEAEDLELETSETDEPVTADKETADKAKAADKKPSEFESGAAVIPINLKTKKSEAERKHLDPDAGDNRVIFISRLPNGFYEPQLKSFFSQFGRVIAVNLARNPKTGKSRHFGFVEFARQDVAEIAAAAMDKYLLAGHRIACEMADEGTEVKNINLKKIPQVGDYSRKNEFAEKLSKSLDAVSEEKTVEKFMKKQEKIKAALETVGVKYDFPPI